MLREWQGAARGDYRQGSAGPLSESGALIVESLSGLALLQSVERVPLYSTLKTGLPLLIKLR